jgi:ATP/maltotriose-dependent transcriptional regulator MalT
VAHGELDEALDPLVSTKLRPSQARPKLVARPRLVGRLDPEAGRRLTLVSAPAGFGKTTLLGKWVKDQMDKERPVAWLSLDEDDNDPARFLSYVVAAVGRATGEEGFGEGMLAALRSPEPPRLEALAGALACRCRIYLGAPHNRHSAVDHENSSPPRSTLPRRTIRRKPP